MYLGSAGFRLWLNCNEYWAVSALTVEFLELRVGPQQVLCCQLVGSRNTHILGLRGTNSLMKRPFEENTGTMQPKLRVLISVSKWYMEAHVSPIFES